MRPSAWNASTPTTFRHGLSSGKGKHRRLTHYLSYLEELIVAVDGFLAPQFVAVAN